MQSAIIYKKEIIEKDVAELVDKADILINNTIANINHELINLYWQIGKMIVEYKKGNNSKYGDTVVSNFSIELSIRYGKGFDKRNIFYILRNSFFNKKQQNVLTNISLVDIIYLDVEGLR